MAAAGSGGGPDPVGGEPLSVDERAALVRLRALVAAQAKHIAFPASGSPHETDDRPAVARSRHTSWDGCHTTSRATY